jgi:hypothetical protein
MSRHTLSLAVIGMFAAVPAAAQPAYSVPQIYSEEAAARPQAQRYAAAPTQEMGGGFIEFLFSGGNEPRRQRAMPADP